MDKTWIVRAHQAGARVFENQGPGKALELLDEIDHPQGRARDGGGTAFRGVLSPGPQDAKR
jgi:hypothetical protein